MKMEARSRADGAVVEWTSVIWSAVAGAAAGAVLPAARRFLTQRVWTQSQLGREVGAALVAGIIFAGVSQH